jgi:tetratricopeptide (TPR) repeat protein
MKHAAGRMMAFLAEAYLRTGDLERANEMARQAVAIGREGGSRWALGWAQRTLGRLARARGAYAVAHLHLEEALATFSAIDARLETGLTQLDLVEVAHALGDQHQARAGLAVAIRLFQDLDLPKRVERTAALARRLGIE